jgi:diaminopimelate decarboxylase
MSMNARAASGQNLTAETLAAIAQHYGTPTYAYDLRRLDRQVSRLHGELPESVQLLYSVKANPSLAPFLSSRGIGADVSSAHELHAVLRAGFAPASVCVSGPYKPAEMLRTLRTVPEAWVSVDSIAELRTLHEACQPNPLLLRLRPRYPAAASMSVGFASRFGVDLADVAKRRRLIRAANVRGLHVFAASQILDARTIASYLQSTLDLCLEAAELLGLAPELLNLGGGFGVPYRPDDDELDIHYVGSVLAQVLDRAGPARVVLELGRYLVAQAGWYLTSVVGPQTRNGRAAVVVDGGVHHRFDLCGLALGASARAPIVVGRKAQARNGGPDPLRATDVLGCLCLPTDVLAEDAQLPRLDTGDVLAFPNAGAYGLTAAPLAFLSHAWPAEVVFDDASVTVLEPHVLPARV